MLGDLILSFMCGYGESRRRMRRIMLGLSPVPFSEMRDRVHANTNVLRVTLSRLKKLGLVENKKSGFWAITEKGKECFLNKVGKNKNLTGLIRNPHGEYGSNITNRPKNMIVVFDIPEKRRGIRDWLRMELVNLGFTPIQKSVWLGPTPLPDSFIYTAGTLGLLKYLRFFNARERDIA